ncbi:MAG: CoA transferase [Chloroflexi bacterium]|nr:CoA transferase [Chloroflexota bacterium]
MNSAGENANMVLSGIRVIDCGQGAIVPLATGYLADFGAEVIKVENYDAMDFSRRGDNAVDSKRDPDRNITFARYNQNKLGVLLNLKHPKGVSLAKRLVATADIVAENLTVGTFERLGLGYEELRKVKPDIIMLSASFGGQSGPYRDFRGQGFVIHALQGLDDLTGWPDRGPVSPGGSFPDHYGPYLWVTVIMAALEHRRQTGRGQFIDGSSFEACLDVLDTAVADYGVSGRVLTRRGNRHPAAAPHGAYRCRGEDRWCAVSVFTDEEWAAFRNVLGDVAWASDERFSTLTGRLKHVDELDALVEEWARGQTAEEVMMKLQGVGVAASVVENIKDIYEDPQLAHREHFWDPKEPGLEPFTFEAPPAKLSKTPARFQRRHPLLGEHSDYVYCELLGLDSEEYARLLDEGVIS